VFILNLAYVVFDSETKGTYQAGTSGGNGRSGSAKPHSPHSTRSPTTTRPAIFRHAWAHRDPLKHCARLSAPAYARSGLPGLLIRSPGTMGAAEARADPGVAAGFTSSWSSLCCPQIRELRPLRCVSPVELTPPLAPATHVLHLRDTDQSDQ
jgi:hypothetical protein